MEMDLPTHYPPRFQKALENQKKNNLAWTLYRPTTSFGYLATIAMSSFKTQHLQSMLQ